jgi:uncharacterized Zn finger protein
VKKIRPANSRDVVKTAISSIKRKQQNGSNSPVTDNLEKTPLVLPEPLNASYDIFWKGGEMPEESALAAISGIKIYATLPKRLGPFPFLRGNEAFLETMVKLYQKASENTAALLVNLE